MSLDYSHLLSVAQRLVGQNGRSVTLTKLGVSIPDPSKPWRGQVDPRAPSSSTVTYSAVFVPLYSKSQLGISKTTADLIKTSDETCLIATSDDLQGFQELTDPADGRTLKIIAAERLKPGSLGLLWFLVLKQ